MDDIFLQALQTIAAAINKPTNLDHILDTILSETKHIIAYDTTSLWLIEQDKAYLVYVNGYEPTDEIRSTVDLASSHMLQASSAPLLITDKQRNLSHHHIMSDETVSEQILTPLLLHGAVIGFWIMNSQQPDRFREDQLGQVQVFSSQISTALYNTRLYHDEMKHQQQVKNLQKTTVLVSSILNLDQLVNRLIDHLHEMIAFQSAVILLVDNQQNVVDLAASWDVSGNSPSVGARFTTDADPLLKALARARYPITITDAAHDERLQNWSVTGNRRNWLGVAMIAHDLCLGYMMIDRDEETFSDDDTRIVHYFANQAAIAIYNAHLYEDVRRYAGQLEERVTERTAQLQTANLQLSRNEQRYRTLFEATFEAICVHDNGTLLDVNPAFENLVGYPANQLIGQSFFDFIANEYRGQTAEYAMKQDDQPHLSEMIHCDGMIIPVEILSKQYRYQGDLVSFVALRDISERKILEAKQFELALHRERIQLLTNFITQTAHEFKTPLAIMKTNTYLLQRVSDEETFRRRLDTIDAQVKYIDDLINNMSTLSRLDSEALQMDLRRTNLNDFLLELRDDLGKYPERAAIHFNLPETPIWVAIDGVYFSQVMKHLLDNAVRFSDEEGEIEIAVSHHDHQVEIAIRDSGVGIAAEHIPHIFERFYRVDIVGTTRGFGLGLTIARSIVEKHHGTITVNSLPGHGSTFTIQLPYHEA